LKSLTLCGSLLVSTSAIYAQETVGPHPAQADRIFYAGSLYPTAAGEAIAADSNQSFESLLMTKVVEARKQLTSDCPIDSSSVGISLWERQSGKIYTVTMAKSNFLIAGYQQQFDLANGNLVTVHIDQPNYVNTKVSVEASEGLFIPLTVKYPIVKSGYLKEMAYYTPAHRCLQGHNFPKLGEQYVGRIMADASVSLKQRGLEVPDKVQNLAKLLCIVEHIDHDRYRNEDTKVLFNEVLTLYALNRGDAFRYSVSSAGAGGMVQMIASTYREIKYSYPQIDWISDFEDGMINHRNAAKAMLCYLRRYDNYFQGLDSVKTALDAGYATEEELMAAGYNSNPAHVPRTLERGEYWKNALPQETQLYLTVLRSLDSSVTTEPPRYHAEPDNVEMADYRPSRYGRSHYRTVKVRSHLKSHTHSVRDRRHAGARSNSRYSSSKKGAGRRSRHHR
jgi:hypothetical protein